MKIFLRVFIKIFVLCKYWRSVYNKWFFSNLENAGVLLMETMVFFISLVVEIDTVSRASR